MNTGNTRFLYFFAKNPRKNPYSGVDFAVDIAVSECFPPQNPSTRVDFEVDFLFRTSDTSPPRKPIPRRHKFRANTFSVPKTRHLGTRKVLEEKFFSNIKKLHHKDAALEISDSDKELLLSLRLFSFFLYLRLLRLNLNCLGCEILNSLSCLDGILKESGIVTD